MPARFCEPFKAAALRGEEGPQRIAGRARETEALHDEIEVEIVDPLAILHRVDDAGGGVDADQTEILMNTA